MFWFCSFVVSDCGRLIFIDFGKWISCFLLIINGMVMGVLC